jgi:hypothetical protein
MSPVWAAVAGNGKVKSVAVPREQSSQKPHAIRRPGSRRLSWECRARRTHRLPAKLQTIKLLRRQPQRRRVSRGLANPPQVEATVRVMHTFRYKAAAAQSAIITTKALTNALAVCYTANTATRGLFYAVKIHRVSVWAPCSAIAAATDVSLRWSGGVLGEDVLLSDTSLNISQPARVSSSPPPRTTAAMWSNNDSDTYLFTLGVPAGAVIDVSLCLAVANSSTTVVTAITTGADGFQ